jgi:hypothetical protein
MILIGYRRGLRASQVCGLQWSQIELATGRLQVCRAKKRRAESPSLQRDELRALRRLQREQGASLHIFITERGGTDDAQDLNGLYWGGLRAVMPFRCIPTWAMAAQCGARHPSLQAYLATRIFSAQCAIRNWHQIGSRTFGDSPAEMRLQQSSLLPGPSAVRRTDCRSQRTHRPHRKCSPCHSIDGMRPVCSAS